MKITRKETTMFLFEFFENGNSPYQSLDSDNSAPKWGERRKTRLTLQMLAKMRAMREVRSFERADNLKMIRTQYGPPPGDSGMGGMGGMGAAPMGGMF
jgi:hypothetical protein